MVNEAFVSLKDNKKDSVFPAFLQRSLRLTDSIATDPPRTASMRDA